MEALMSKLPCKNQSEDSLQPRCLRFRKSAEASRSLNRDAVDTTEAHRKAAAWAWHQRGGGEVMPTRPKEFQSSAATVSGHSRVDNLNRDAVDTTEGRGRAATGALHQRGGGEVIPTRPRAFQSSIAAVSGHSRVDRPVSLMKVEATRDTGAHASSSNSTSGSGKSLFDASELSSLAQQIAGFAQKLQDKSSSEDFRARIEADKLIERALDPPWTSDQQAFDKEFARHRRPLSDFLRPRQILRETGGVLGTDKNGVDSESRVDTGCFSRMGLPNMQSTKTSSLKKSFFLIQNFCLKVPSVHDDPSSDLNRNVFRHHHYHHHHHYYHYQTPDEELRIVERPKGRRNLESYTPFKERESADDEAQSNAADMATAYWASVGDKIAAARGDKSKNRDYDHNFDPRDENLQSTTDISKDRASWRQSERFDNSRDKACGSPHLESPRMRRHSAEIGPSYRPRAGNGSEIVEWE